MYLEILRKHARRKIKKKYIVVEPRSTRDIEILFKVIVKVPVVGNTFFCNFWKLADTPNPPRIGVSAVLPTDRHLNN